MGPFDSATRNIRFATGIAAGAGIGCIWLMQPSLADATTLVTNVFGVTSRTLTLLYYAIMRGYNAAPALMLGLAAGLSIPLLAFSAVITRRAQRSRDATRRYRGQKSSIVADDDVADHGGMTGQAFVEVVGQAGVRFTIAGDMMRIGREEDNDIRIPSGAVHRYHAAIHREDIGDWRITDLSGIEGNGVAVNGQRCADCALRDGDVIDLGPGRLRFRSAHG